MLRFSSLNPSIWTARCKSGFSPAELFLPESAARSSQIADQFARAARLLSDLLRIRQLLKREIAAGRHVLAALQNRRERILEFTRGQRDQFSERRQLRLQNRPSLEPFEIVEALARSIEEIHQPLIEQVLFEKNEKRPEWPRHAIATAKRT